VKLRAYIQNAPFAITNACHIIRYNNEHYLELWKQTEPLHFAIDQVVKPALPTVVEIN
jgi:hypothetical protein